MRVLPTPPDLRDILARKQGPLASALADERYQTIVRECEDAYRHWDKLRIIAQASDLDPELVWALLKIGRRYRELPLHGHGGVRLRFTVPDQAQRDLMLIDQELGGRIGFDDDRPLTSSERERFVLGALQEEAIASSILEGAATTRRVAKEMLRSGRRPRSRGERMVSNSYRAISFIREHRRTALSPSFVVELQTMLTEGTLDDPREIGRLRRADDDVAVVDPYGEVLHTPTPAGELERRLDDLCSFANAPRDDRAFVHPVVKACVLHFQVGFDHPFCDGNGRTARALFYWSMLRDGYWLFEFLPISRLIQASPAKYGRAYLHAETDAFDVTYFILYKLGIISRARRDLANYLARKQAEMTEARRLADLDPGLNHRQREILLEITRNPDRVVTIENHRGVHAIAYATARADLFGLVDRGYLTKERRGKRFEFRRGPRI